MSFVQSSSNLTVDYTISMKRCLLCIDVPGLPFALAIHHLLLVQFTNVKCPFRLCAEFYRVVDMIPVCNTTCANCLTAFDCISMQPHSLKRAGGGSRRAIQALETLNSDSFQHEIT